ncbi:MAG: FtsH protease activity modulator HflK [Pseudomonadales bacterium]|jgi:membrane protease subunit HflK
MAWNEPGNNKGRDPWNDRGNGNDQGPPDLDEVLRKLQNKLNKAFGGKGKGSGGSGKGGAALSGGLILIILIGALVLWAIAGFYTIDQQERGVVLRLGKYHETVQPGLQWNPRFIDSVEKVNVTKVRSHSSRGTMLTEDENIVDVSLSVQYIVSDPKDFVLNVRDPELSLAHATESALRHVVGSSEMHNVLTEGREILAVDVQKRLQNYVDNYGAGLLISKVNIENSQAPREVQAAFDDVIKAREDEVRAINEAETYRNGIIPEARGYAQRLLEEANAYKAQVVAQAEGDAARFNKLYTEYKKAPEVTRERLYIDALQKVLSSSSKVLVDVEGGNNMLYLPLDKLTGKAPGVSGTAGSERISSSQLDDLTNQVINRIRERQNSSNLREGR